MAYNWNNLFGSLVTAGQPAVKETSLDKIISVAQEYQEYHCASHNTSKYATWDTTYNGTLKTSHDATYKSYNSYNSGKLSSNYSSNNSGQRYSYLAGNIG